MPCDAAAQLLRGIVRDASSHVPIRGARVETRDARDSTVAATTTSTTGVFIIGKPVGGHLAVRAIGYRPARSPIADVADPVDVVIDLEPLPRILDTIYAVRDEGCRRDRTTARARELWQAALATVRPSLWDVDQQVPITVAREWVPGGGGRGAPVLRVRRAGRAFVVARRALETRLVGSATSDDTTLFGPAFLAALCVKLESDRDHPGEVAIRFTPPRGERSMLTVDGRLWIDTTDVAIRSLVYEYARPTLAHRDPAAVRVVFARAADGAALVARWSISMNARFRATPGTRIILPGGAFGRVARDTVDEPVFAVWDTSLTFLGTLPHLIGQVVDRATGRGMSGARVTVARSPTIYTRTVGLERHTQFLEAEAAETRVAVTDAAGHFDLELPGRSAILRVVDTTLSEFRPYQLGEPPSFDTTMQPPPAGGVWDERPWGTFVALRARFDDDEHARIEASASPDALRDACGMRRQSRDASVVAGRLGDALRRAADTSGVQVIVSAAWNGGTHTVAADSLGYFRFCNVPLGAGVTLAAPVGSDTVRVRLQARDVISTIVIR